MGNWFPKLYDLAMKPLETTRFKKVRTQLVRHAEGRVLEIGSGTGINFPYYRNATRVDAIEPNPLMSNQSKNRLREADVPISLHLSTAEKLPFADDTFNTVVSTLVFCTIPDPAKAIEEIMRVSKKDAKLLFFEHVRMDQKLFGKTQDLLNPLWMKICDGCHLNRDTLKWIKDSGLTITKVDSHYTGLFLQIQCLNKK